MNLLASPSPFLCHEQETFLDEEKQVIIHCAYNNADHFETLIRIWSSTFLMQNDQIVARLLFSENITMHPMWTVVSPHSIYYFCLIFSGLPKDCLCFDLVEKIPEPDGFLYKNIIRNASDVYRIELQ